MNELPKIVFLRTLEKVEWKNSRLVKENISEEIVNMKQQPGKDLAIYGSADLASFLLPLGLIDENRVFVNPVVLGAGTPMFMNINNSLALKVLKSTTMSSDIVALHYQPDSKDAT